MSVMSILAYRRNVPAPVNSHQPSATVLQQWQPLRRDTSSITALEYFPSFLSNSRINSVVLHAFLSAMHPPFPIYYSTRVLRFTAAAGNCGPERKRSRSPVRSDRSQPELHCSSCLGCTVYVSILMSSSELNHRYLPP